MATPGERLEEEARIALKEDYRSQMQNYRTTILTLFIAFFAGIEVLRLLIEVLKLLPYWLAVDLFCLASGLLAGGIFYCVARVAYYGRIGSYVLTAAPIGLSRQRKPTQNTNTLIYRTQQGTRNLAMSPEELTKSPWDRLVSLGEPGQTKTPALLASSCIVFLLTFDVAIFCLGECTGRWPWWPC